MATLSTLPLALSSDEKLLLTGALNHGIYASTEGGAAWLPVGLQGGSWYYDIADVAISPAYASDHTLFAAWRNGAGIGSSYYRTTDSGATWQRVYSTDYVGTLAISPQYASDHTLYASARTGRVMSSTNGGDQWTEVGAWPSGSAGPGVTQVALPPNYSTDGTVFAAGNQGAYACPPTQRPGSWPLPA